MWNRFMDRMRKFRGKRAIELTMAAWIVAWLASAVGYNLVGYAVTKQGCRSALSCPEGLFWLRTLDAISGISLVIAFVFVVAEAAALVVEHWHDERRREP
jgi:hypothetical protein